MKQKAINKINFFGILYAVFALAVSNLIFSKAVLKLGLDSGFGIAFSVIVFLLSFGIYMAVNKAGGKIHVPFFDSLINRNIISFAIAALLIIAGICLRREAVLTGNYSLGDYLDISKVDGSSAEYFVHGAVRFYTCLLRAVFIAFGNRYIPALIFQIFCQLTGFILIYFALKNTAGDICALSFMTFGCISPAAVKASCTLGPSQICFLAGALAIYILSCCVRLNNITYILAGIAGLISGFLFYLDISGISVIVLSCIILINDTVKDNSRKKRKKLISGDRMFVFMVFLTAALIGTVLFLVLDILIHGGKISTLVSEVAGIYVPKEFSLYAFYTFSDEISVSIAVGLLILGTPWVVFRKNAGFNIYFTAALVTAALTGFSMISDEMNGNCYLLFFVFALAGFSFSMLASTLLEQCDESGDKKRSTGLADTEETKHTVHKLEDEVEMLQNPLPVPEKKKKKKMDYDYYVPDESDYDL